MPQESEILEFINVSFGYSEDKLILKKVNFRLLEGKTYALVGPTGGGKSTTAGLMARLYDPTFGEVEFGNTDIRTYTPQELSKNIGFILQDPFLFSGNVGDNIRYGNEELEKTDNTNLLDIIEQEGFGKLISIFEKGLETEVSNASESISLGQKQIISFMRILLRKPKLLILDEATANIDTVTEQILNEIIAKLPVATTKVIIAHRLNTIKDADEILFINNGKIKTAVDFDDAISLIDNSKRVS